MNPAACLLLPALAACAQVQPPVAVANSPPPLIISVPSPPPVPPFYAVPAPPPGPPPPLPAVVRPPRARAPAQALISVLDYPPSALRRGQQGRVAFTLDIGPNGRAHGCTITRSSGSSALDSATCAILRRRGRFTPAVDSNGMPAAGRVSDEVEWVLPEGAGTERG